MSKHSSGVFGSVSKPRGFQADERARFTEDFSALDICSSWISHYPQTRGRWRCGIFSNKKPGRVWCADDWQWRSLCIRRYYIYIWCDTTSIYDAHFEPCRLWKCSSWAYQLLKKGAVFLLVNAWSRSAKNAQAHSQANTLSLSLSLYLYILWRGNVFLILVEILLQYGYNDICISISLSLLLSASAFFWNTRSLCSSKKTLALLPPVLVLRKPKPVRLAITGMNAEELHLGRCENC